jgi:hypothetical protein
MFTRAREYQIAFVRAAIALLTRICSDLLPCPWRWFREHMGKHGFGAKRRRRKVVGFIQLLRCHPDDRSATSRR